MDILNIGLAFRPRALGALAVLAFPLVAACDDYEGPPPATPATVEPQAEAQPAAAEAQADTYADTDPSALSDFHTTLDPHGQWVEDPAYGTIWVPNAAEVGADFSPYETAGHWAYDDDYVWVSDYDWGWAPFHYGRWVLTSGGWAWIPGRTYAGAWVDWQMGGPGWGYVGWGPMYPAFIWRGGLAVGYVAVNAPGHFYYCPQGAIFAPNVRASVVVGPQVAVVGAHMTAYGGGGVGVGVSVAAHAHGPAPASLGIAPQNVPHPSPGDKGTAMAKGFAHPSTATQMGGHPPAGRQPAHPTVAKQRGGGYRGGGGRVGGGSHAGHK